MSQEVTFLEFDQYKVPFNIINESRRSVRVAFTNKDITVRLPHSMSTSNKLQHIEKSKLWALKQLKAKPGLLGKIFGKIYKNGDYLKLVAKKYLLHFLYHDRKTNKSVIKGNLLELHLSTENKPEQEQEIIRYLISRTVANDFYPEIRKRVMEINDLYFKQNIKEVKLSLSQTNWGSCSTTGTINLSARLLFAPLKVIDYVIIHELAHLIEHNHSSRFWSQVKRVMPDYEVHDQWLNKNSHLCDF